MGERMRDGLRRAGARLPTARRVPRRLADLHGPLTGTVVLPVHLTWAGHREFDVSEDEPRLLLYSIVLSKGRRNDLARFVNPLRLREDWPRLAALVSPRTRRATERMLRPVEGSRPRAADRG